jgi:hypothetical protein
MRFIKYDADNPVNFKNPLILTIFIFFSANTLHALTPVIIDENTESVSLGKYMEILEDPFSINLLNPLRGLYVY